MPINLHSDVIYLLLRGGGFGGIDTNSFRLIGLSHTSFIPVHHAQSRYCLSDSDYRYTCNLCMMLIIAVE